MNLKLRRFLVILRLPAYFIKFILVIVQLLISFLTLYVDAVLIEVLHLYRQAIESFTAIFLDLPATHPEGF